MQRPAPQIIAASPKDLKNNRLGLMSQEQLLALQEQIDQFELRMSQWLRRAVTYAAMITILLVILSFVRVIWLPLALLIEVLVIGMMLYLTMDVNRFVQQMMIDREAAAVRIVKGRTSRYTLRTHPLYSSLRIEVQSYKLLDSTLARQFTTGDLYQFYVLPQSGVIIAAEAIDEKSLRHLF